MTATVKWDSRTAGVPLEWRAFILLVLSIGCGPPVTLSNSFDSPEAAARAVLAALDRRDVETLERLALTEDEFRRLVWPQLPASRPERNIPLNYAWKTTHARSRQQLQERLAEWPPGGLELVKVEFAEETTDYQTYRVHRDTTLTLRGADNNVVTKRIFGSMIEQNGRYKVYSYVVD
jgi:hypothetical protein